ncbi:hypothetical protein WMC41_16050 [Shinella yambaruensis]|uniref:hypothetical protein n=1 Tax=Shinella yambaruensis TaxID=415996 RepID=UPI003D7BA7EC
MTEQDYVAFCNLAHDLQHIARRFCADLGDEQARQLHGFVQNELAATAAGKVAPAYDFLAAILAEEVEPQGQVANSATRSTTSGGADVCPI